MRIIDSNTDFYDFYQNVYRDDHLVFDRRDSYNLSKEEFMNYFNYSRTFHFGSRLREDVNRIRHILLQICNTFWLCEMYFTKIDNYDNVTDYTLKLIHTWKDYSLPTEKFKLSEISFEPYFAKDGCHSPKHSDIEDMQQSIHISDYQTKHVFTNFLKRREIKGKMVEEIYTIPILQNIGFASCIHPLDIYLALEEYFSTQITSSERTESIGLTDKEKIENHGFDVKNSFRGKV